MDLVNEIPVLDAAAAQYLSFSLAEGEYAVKILHVREIRGIGPITPLPNAPHHLKGVMNLRGAIVPVVDLKVALGLPESDYDKFTVIIVLSVGGRTMGFVVDSVCDVVSLESTDIENTSEIGNGVDDALIDGIARAQERFIILLDVERIAAVDVAA